MQQYWLFDLDGTLIDSMEIWAGVHIHALQQAGIPVPPDFVDTITPLGNLRASRYTLSMGIPKTLEQYLEETGEILLREYTRNIPLKPHVKEALEQMKARGIRLQVLTASPHRFADPCLQRCGIWDLFEHVWTIDDFGLTKGSPEIYLEAAARLGALPEQCVMVDDNIFAITAAKEAGLDTVAVYDRSSAASEGALRHTAGRYICSFGELL